MTHICVANLTIIGPDNGLSPGRRQAIIWTNAGILFIGPWGTNLSEVLIGIQTFSFKKMLLKMSSAKWRPFCLGLNGLTHRLMGNLAIIVIVWFSGSYDLFSDWYPSINVQAWTNLVVDPFSVFFFRPVSAHTRASSRESDAWERPDTDRQGPWQYIWVRLRLRGGGTSKLWCYGMIYNGSIISVSSNWCFLLEVLEVWKKKRINICGDSFQCGIIWCCLNCQYNWANPLFAFNRLIMIPIMQRLAIVYKWYCLW